MATQRTFRTTDRTRTTAMMGVLTLATAALLCTVFITLRLSAPAEQLVPVTGSADAPAVSSGFPGMGNRIFADEVAGATAQYTDPASITGPLPERLSDFPQMAAPAVVTTQAAVSAHNRIFADEIAAGAQVGGWSGVEGAATVPQHGPR